MIEPAGLTRATRWLGAEKRADSDGHADANTSEAYCRAVLNGRVGSLYLSHARAIKLIASMIQF